MMPPPPSGHNRPGIRATQLTVPEDLRVHDGIALRLLSTRAIDAGEFARDGRLLSEAARNAAI